jgi:hypothetical protein
MKTIGNIVAAILIFFGVLFMWSAFTPETGIGNLIIGVLSVAFGLGIAWYVNRKPPAEQKITYELELTGDVNLENFQCKKCGGSLSSKNAKLIAGAMAIECPYCGAVYQLEEKPKW